MHCATFFVFRDSLQEELPQVAQKKYKSVTFCEKQFFKKKFQYVMRNLKLKKSRQFPTSHIGADATTTGEITA